MFSHSYNDKEATLFIESFENEMKVLNLEVIRFDDSIFANASIYDTLTEAINVCDIFVCFINPSSANVMFELGYAMGIGKNVIIIGEHAEIPSDLQGRRYISRSIPPYEFVSLLERFVSETETVPIDYKTLDINTLVNNPDIINQLNGLDFENIIMKYFKKKGYEISELDRVNDLGYDFTIDSFNGEKTIVEVKKYHNNSKVPIEAVRKLESAMFSEKINIGLLITNSDFTEAARSYSSNSPVKIMLCTLKELIEL